VATTASVERRFHALWGIKIYLRSTARQDTLCQLSILSLEKVLFAEIKKAPKFYDAVIEKFTAINGGGEIHFK
jgi:hypothetical protein